MIELAEAHVLAQQMNEMLVGRTITAIEAAHTPHGFAFFHGDPVVYPAILGGKTITAVEPFGGRVEIEAGDARLCFNDGTNLRYLRPGDKRPARHQLLLEFDDGSGLYVTIQMYGGIVAHFVGEPMGFYSDVAHEKPSPLTDAFDRAYFETLFEGIKPSLSAKAILATEQRIPGLGNGTSQDILWRAQIHPKAKALSLSPTQRDTLFASIKETTARMAELGGRDTEKDFFSHSGGYRTILSNKTLIYPCPRCGGPITRQAYLGGNVYFCATCQPL